MVERLFVSDTRGWFFFGRAMVRLWQGNGFEKIFLGGAMVGLWAVNGLRADAYGSFLEGRFFF